MNQGEAAKSEAQEEHKEDHKHPGEVDGFEVTPYGVFNTSGKEIDYDKLITSFGCSKIAPEMIAK